MSSPAQRAAASLLGLVMVAALWWVVVGRSDQSQTQRDSLLPQEWMAVQMIDGDTFDAERDGVRERVRIIGIDTPEREQCGYEEASAALRDAVSGRTITLVSGAETDRDTYGRLLRYVEIDGVDVGLTLIEDGFAVARYDSRSNQPHDRERQYWDADDASADLCPAN